MNPADFPSRDCNVRTLISSKWWEGPEWLKTPPELWPIPPVEVEEDVVSVEKRKTASSSRLDPWLRKFSKYEKIIRICAWVVLFRNITKETGVKDELSAEEIQNAEYKL